MRLKLLSCDVLTREVSYCLARCPHTISPVFTPKGEHNVPERLREHLQSEIDKASEEDDYEYILMAYGLCGNATVGLRSRSIPLVIPRAHDCTTLFLGSKSAFQEHFGDNPSQCWASVGYAERGDKLLSDDSTRNYLGTTNSYDALVAQYGEENAKFLYETMQHDRGAEKIFYIRVPETTVESVEVEIRKQAAEQELPLHELQGSIGLIEKLLNGPWDEDAFLTVPPNHRIVGQYDMEQVASAEPVE